MKPQRHDEQTGSPPFENSGLDRNHRTALLKPGQPTKPFIFLHGGLRRYPPPRPRGRSVPPKKPREHETIHKQRPHEERALISHLGQGHDDPLEQVDGLQVAVVVDEHLDQGQRVSAEPGDHLEDKHLVGWVGFPRVVLCSGARHARYEVPQQERPKEIDRERRRGGGGLSGRQDDPREQHQPRCPAATVTAKAAARSRGGALPRAILMSFN